MDPLEDQQIEEVHSAKNKQHQPDLVGKSFNSLLAVLYLVPDL
jgi:hypothetical protein